MIFMENYLYWPLLQVYLMTIVTIGNSFEVTIYVMDEDLLYFNDNCHDVNIFSSQRNPSFLSVANLYSHPTPPPKQKITIMNYPSR